MLQRNGRLTNLSAYNTVPRYNRSAVTRHEDCGCGATPYTTAEHCGCGAKPYTTAERCGCNTGCDECGYAYTCGQNTCTSSIPLAISSIKVQKWCDLYDLEQGFCAATIFKQLDLPFCGTRGGH